jgi:hypothetical protein
VTVTWFGVTLHEFDVAFTDFLLFVEAATFSALLFREPAPHHARLRTLGGALFALLGASSLLGVVFHAFFPLKASSAGGHAVWMLTGISIALTTSAVWYINAVLTRYRKLGRLVESLVPVYFAAFVFALFFVDYTFKTMISFYAPAVVLLAIIAVRTYARSRAREWVYLTAGTGLSFTAAAVQAMKIGVHPVYFNFNALYHLIQGIALVFLFLAFRRLVQRPDPRAENAFHRREGGACP